jgi:hypothetical protein
MHIKLFIATLISSAGLFYGAKAQSLSPSVLSSSGSYFEAGSFSLSTTIGEPLTETLTNSNNILTQGFQQPDYTVISNIEEAYLPQLNIKVYPNPADKQLYMLVSTKENANAYLTLTDIQGKTILQETITYNSLKSIDISALAQGSYMLIHQSEQGKIISTHQIQKVK